MHSRNLEAKTTTTPMRHDNGILIYSSRSRSACWWNNTILVMWNIQTISSEKFSLGDLFTYTRKIISLHKHIMWMRSLMQGQWGVTFPIPGTDLNLECVKCLGNQLVCRHCHVMQPIILPLTIIYFTGNVTVGSLSCQGNWKLIESSSWIHCNCMTASASLL